MKRKSPPTGAPMGRADKESWDRLCRYASILFRCRTAFKPDELVEMPLSTFLTHLRRYQLLTRLYHRDPAFVRRGLLKLSDGELDALRKLHLFLHPTAWPNQFLLEMLAESARRTRQKYSETYRALAAEFDWRRFEKERLHSPQPGDEEIEYVILPLD